MALCVWMIRKVIKTDNLNIFPKKNTTEGKNSFIDDIDIIKDDLLKKGLDTLKVKHDKLESSMTNKYNPPKKGE